MVAQVVTSDRPSRPQEPPRRTPSRVAFGTVVARRAVGLALAVGPLLWALERALPAGGALVNTGGLALLGDLAGSVLHPALGATFLGVVARAALVTVVFAALGTAGALVIGAVGGLVLSDVAWGQRPPGPVRLVRLALRGVLVAVRAVHELIWALLLVSVLGLDPLVAVLAIAVPFGAQTAKVFAETLDGVPPGPLAALRTAGAPRAAAMAYALVPQAVPMLVSYSFYRFECAIRSAVILGVVGVGGLGQELVVSLSSRNWDEVWTLIGAVLVLSALVDAWSTRLRADLAVVSCADWSGGVGAGRPMTSRWARGSALVAVPGLIMAWMVSGVSLAGLTSPRTALLTERLLADLWPPALPRGGWPEVVAGTLDTLAMAVLAMVVAVALTLLLGPWAARPRPSRAEAGRSAVAVAVRWLAWGLARLALLTLRSVPPTVWAVVALLALFPGVLPGAVALGLYTGGILGRLVAEAWESVDERPRAALTAAGVPPALASLVAMVPPSAHHLLTYALYRFEICVRDTAVVGVVGAAGLGRLLAENLAVFRFPVVTTLLVASFAVSVAAEVFGRWLRRSLRP